MPTSEAAILIAMFCLFLVSVAILAPKRMPVMQGMHAGRRDFIGPGKSCWERPLPEGTVWMRDGWPGFNALTDGDAVLANTALNGFAFSVGQSKFGASVEVVRFDAARQTPAAHPNSACHSQPD